MQLSFLVSATWLLASLQLADALRLGYKVDRPIDRRQFTSTPPPVATPTVTVTVTDAGSCATASPPEAVTVTVTQAAACPTLACPVCQGPTTVTVTQPGTTVTKPASTVTKGGITIEVTITKNSSTTKTVTAPCTAKASTVTQCKTKC